MTYLPILATVAALYLLAVVSPGPNFFIITQLALAGQRRIGVRVALGITVGSTIWAILAMAGVAVLLSRVGWLYELIRLGGAAYLIWFGIKLLFSAARRPMANRGPAAFSSSRAFRAGLMTSLTNPKSGAFWTGIFASVFPAAAPPWIFVATAAIIAALSAGWHCGLAYFFSSQIVQTTYKRIRHWIDAVCGAFLIGLGLRLAATR